MKKRLSTMVFLLVFSVLAVRAEAILYFTASNQFGPWEDEVPAGYGYVDVTRGTNDWIFFEVGANADYFAGSGLNWNRFYFNFAGDELDKKAIQVDAGGNWKIVEDHNVSEFGRFDFGIERGGFGSEGNDPLRFRIEDAALDPADFILVNNEGWLFAGHLQRFAAMDDATSNYLAAGDPSTPVPEPGTLLLLGAGLGSLALGRRKARSC